jgi:hypothetical protein
MQDSRDAVKDLASQIESQAREVQRQVNAGEDFNQVCNALIRNAITLVFSAGEAYALSQLQKTTNAVRTIKVGNKNYHNVRNALGRFAPKNP